MSFKINFSFPKELLTSSSSLMGFLYLGLIVSGFAYITFINTIKSYSAIAASLIFLFKPALASLFSMFFLNHQLGNMFFYGLVLIMGGAFLIIHEKVISFFKSKLKS